MELSKKQRIALIRFRIAKRKNKEKAVAGVMGAHLPFKQSSEGSSPSRPTNIVPVA